MHIDFKFIVVRSCAAHIWWNELHNVVYIGSLGNGSLHICVLYEQLLVDDRMNIKCLHYVNHILMSSFGNGKMHLISNINTWFIHFHVAITKNWYDLPLKSHAPVQYRANRFMHIKTVSEIVMLRVASFWNSIFELETWITPMFVRCVIHLHGEIIITI